MSDWLPPTEFSEKFAGGMRARMAVSFHKYGPVADGFPDKVDAIATLLVRLDQYKETGNTEFLVDVANYAMIEFMHPRHPQAHFKPTDSDGTPGRIRADGQRTKKANSDIEPTNETT